MASIQDTAQRPEQPSYPIILPRRRRVQMGAARSFWMPDGLHKAAWLLSGGYLQRCGYLSR